MKLIKKYAPGEFCWTDLGTTNADAAKKFYQSLFGWKAKDVPMGTGDAKYSMMRVRGRDACAIYPRPSEQRGTKSPPAWIPYVSVASANATAKKAKAAGGKVCIGPMDFMDEGRGAILQDPTGATVGIWQARKHHGAGLDDAPGAVSWHDLSTSRPKPAGTFYTKVFGWTLDEMAAGGNKYYLFKVGKKGECGMWPEPMKKLPPCWVTYFQVENCAKTVVKAKRLGGRVLMGTTLVPQMVRFAVLKDPQGAAFGILAPIR